MPANDSEVYAYLTGDNTDSLEIDMLTFAIYANQKQEWVRHFERQRGTPPSQTEIDDWIANLTEGRFNAMRREAVEFFDASARRYLAEEIAEGKDAVLRCLVPG
jgi:hypothetical protein